MPTLGLELERTDGNEGTSESMGDLDADGGKLPAIGATGQDGLFAAFLQQSPVYLYIKTVTPTERSSG